MPARAWKVNPVALADPVWECQGEAVTALHCSLQSSFREERFSDGGCVSPAERTTCYPGRRHRGAPAHYGVSVTVKGSENECAQPINRPKTAKKLHGSRAVFRKVLYWFKLHRATGLGRGHDPSQLLGGASACFPAPQINEQLPGKRNDRPLPCPQVGFGVE